MFMNRKTLHCRDVSFSQIDPQIQSKPNQNPSKLFYGFQQTHSTVYMESQKTQNSQHNIEGEEQSWRSDTTTSRLTIKLQQSRQCGTGKRTDI